MISKGLALIIAAALSLSSAPSYAQTPAPKPSTRASLMLLSDRQLDKVTAGLVTFDSVAYQSALNVWLRE
jgi:hypothetical protein